MFNKKNILLSKYFVIETKYFCIQNIFVIIPFSYPSLFNFSFQKYILYMRSIKLFYLMISGSQIWPFN